MLVSLSPGEMDLYYAFSHPDVYPLWILKAELESTPLESAHPKNFQCARAGNSGSFGARGMLVSRE